MAFRQFCHFRPISLKFWPISDNSGHVWPFPAHTGQFRSIPVCCRPVPGDSGHFRFVSDELGRIPANSGRFRPYPVNSGLMPTSSGGFRPFPLFFPANSSKVWTFCPIQVFPGYFLCIPGEFRLFPANFGQLPSFRVYFGRLRPISVNNRQFGSPLVNFSRFLRIRAHSVHFW